MLMLSQSLATLGVEIGNRARDVSRRCPRHTDGGRRLAEVSFYGVTSSRGLVSRVELWISPPWIAATSGGWRDGIHDRKDPRWTRLTWFWTWGRTVANSGACRWRR